MRATIWDTEWAAEKASEARRYLADFYPECAASPKLYIHQDGRPRRGRRRRPGGLPGGSQKVHEGREGRGPADEERCGGVTEEDRLRRAVERLMDGQREALGIVRAALEAGDRVRTDDALPDLQDVLEGALEDARADLGIEEGGTA